MSDRTEIGDAWVRMWAAFAELSGAEHDDAVEIAEEILEAHAGDTPSAESIDIIVASIAERVDALLPGYERRDIEATFLP